MAQNPQKKKHCKRVSARKFAKYEFEESRI